VGSGILVSPYRMPERCVVRSIAYA